MKISKKKLIWLIGGAIIIIGIIVGGEKINNKIEWMITKEVISAGGFPYQIGLLGVSVIPCFTTGVPPVCEGGTLCYTKDAATCAAYADVSGTPAGGMGSNALFLKTALTQAGVVSGGQLIAGGMSPVLMDNGVLAGPGGCYNCLAKLDWKGRLKNKAEYLFKYIIAGIKEKGN